MIHYTIMSWAIMGCMSERAFEERFCCSKSTSMNLSVLTTPLEGILRIYNASRLLLPNFCFSVFCFSSSKVKFRIIRIASENTPTFLQLSFSVSFFFFFPMIICLEFLARMFTCWQYGSSVLRLWARKWESLQICAIIRIW